MVLRFIENLIRSVVNETVDKATGTPYSALHDIDANKPSGSIKIRVKTYAHSLTLYEERLQDLARKKAELQRRLEQKWAELLSRNRHEPSAAYPDLPAQTGN